MCCGDGRERKGQQCVGYEERWNWRWCDCGNVRGLCGRQRPWWSVAYAATSGSMVLLQWGSLTHANTKIYEDNHDLYCSLKQVWCRRGALSCLCLLSAPPILPSSDIGMSELFLTLIYHLVVMRAQQSWSQWHGYRRAGPTPCGSSVCGRDDLDGMGTGKLAGKLAQLHPGPDQGLWVGLPQYVPIYEVLEHMKRSVLWIHSCRSLMT